MIVQMKNKIGSKFSRMICFAFIPLGCLSCHNREISNPVDPRFDLAAPALLSAAANKNNGITLTWESKDGSPKFFNIYRKSKQQSAGEIYHVIAGNKYAYLDTAIERNAEYTYQVQANWYGRLSGISNSLTAGVFQVFQRLYGNGESVGNYAVQTQDGGFILAGAIQTTKMWIMKTDRYGNQEWTKTLGEFEGIYIEPTLDKGYIVLGSSGYSYRDIKLQILKLDQNGNLAWSKQIGYVIGRTIKQTQDGGYVLFGHSVQDESSFFLSRMDPNGNTVWQKFYFNKQVVHTGALDVTSDGEFVFAGTIETGIYPNDQRIICMVKTDINGNEKWHKTFMDSDFGYPRFISESYCYSLQRTTDESFILLTTLQAVDFSGNYEGYIWLIRTDETGNRKWAKQYYSEWTQPSQRDGTGRFVKQTGDGGFVLLASVNELSTAGDYFEIYKTNAAGLIEWNRKIVGLGEARGRSVHPILPNGYIVIGSTVTKEGFGDNKVILLKLDANGNFK